MSGEFPKTFMQSRPCIPFKSQMDIMDTAVTDCRDNEIQGMNQDHRDDVLLQEAGHCD